MKFKNFTTKRDEGRSIVRVHNSLVSKFDPDSSYLVSANGRKIVANVLGGGAQIKGLSADTLALDASSVRYLKLTGEMHDITLVKASSFQMYLCYANSGDPAIRTATRLGIWGVVLGIAGITLSVAPMILG